MNETVTSTASPELEQQVAALQRQVFILLVALFVVTATVVFYLFYQSRILSQNYAEIRPGDTQVIDGYRKNALTIQGFEKKLVDFGTMHPSFEPILQKYGLVKTPGAPMTPAP